MSNVQNYLPNVVAAVLILVVGLAAAGVAGAFAHRLLGDTSTGRMVRAIAPTLILAVVVFMVLTQLQIAPAIVTTTYVALIGMLAVAGALAFSWRPRGRRGHAARCLDSRTRRAPAQAAGHAPSPAESSRRTAA